MKYLDAIIRRSLAAFGILTGNKRQDDAITAAFSRQLQFIMTRTFDRKYPGLKARSLIPVNTEIPAGAEYFVMRAYDMAGMAKVITDYSDDLPTVEINGKEIVQPIRSLGNGYQYSVQELRASSMAGGTPIDQRKAQAVRRAMENALEILAALGDTTVGLPGFVNNTNVTTLTATELVGGWDTATSAQILADLNLIANTVVTDSKDIHHPDTLVLPTSRYGLLATKPYSDLSPDTILTVFLRNSPWIRNIEQWHYLDLADSAGTGPRLVMFERNSENIELIIPQDFEQFPPQPVNLSFRIPCHMRYGGVSLRYPLSMIYAEDI